MKVLFIHCRYKLPGGEDGVVASEVELLRSHGVDVQLLPFSNEGSSLLKVLQLPFNIGSYLKTRRKLQGFKPDIVHIHNLHFAGSSSVLYALKHLHIPFVITVHNFRLLCPSGTLYYNERPYLKSLSSRFPWSAVKDGVYNHSKLLTFWVGLSTWIHRLIGTWRIADRYIFLTAHSKGVFQQSRGYLQEDKIVIKPNFVYDPLMGESSRKNGFLFIGRLSEEKGLKVLLEAFKHSPHAIRIIGDGPLKKLVETTAKDHPNISYLGYQQKEAIMNELRKCSALIFPSVWYETFGLTIIEAFATATPVIASNIGSPTLLIKNGYNGLHFEESNAVDLRTKLDGWAAFSEMEKERFGKNARQSYERYYTPTENLEQLLSIYISVIDEKKRTLRSGNTVS